MSTKEGQGSTILGIDIGGSGIKGAPVDVEKGVLVADRLRVPTPRPAFPETVADVVAEERVGCPVTLVNDADAAGMAEMRFGAGRDQPGLVVMITLGTGIGTALFMDGRLVPNAELGHLVIRGKDAEERASDRARSRNGWGWKRWAKRLDEYLRYVEALLSPDLFIVGGGVSKKHERFLGYLTTSAAVVPAEMRNEAGIIGAALAAEAQI